MAEISANDPVELFREWLEEARRREPNDPEAMCLATCDAAGQPSARMILLKTVDESGFKFHTNAESRKGRDIAENPQAALCFHWKSLRRQVRVEGVLKEVSEEEADEYFKSRPRGRQIGAWASRQSQPLESRKILEDSIVRIAALYDGRAIPRPPYWKGYRLRPDAIEFWLDGPDRLHDRFLFRREKDGTWLPAERLYP